MIRPLVAVATVVGLLALGLAISNLANRMPGLTPLIWLQPLLPAALAAWLLVDRPVIATGALAGSVG